MNQELFINSLLEFLFVQGFDAERNAVSREVQKEWESLVICPDVASFAAKCTQRPWLARPAIMPDGQIPASTTAGAREKWLAVHEAGHTIVGIEAGLFLKGVRFYGTDGFPGQSGFEDPAWTTSCDEELLRRLIRVDVAGNIAELLRPDCRLSPDRLSKLYDDRTQGFRPTDFISADARAIRLAKVLFDRSGNAIDTEVVWKARRCAVEQAEEEAERILRANLEGLDRLTKRFQSGPITGAEVRRLLGII